MIERQPLRIALLGGFHVQIGEKSIPAEAWRRRKVRDLIKLLALARGYSLHREQVMDLLWPDADPQAALNSLHQTLYLARRVLEPGGPSPASYLLLQDEIVTLGPPERVWVDVAAFEAAAAHARQRQDPAAYHAALELYTGELLPEDRYEEWASARREALQQAYMALLRDLARLAEARGLRTGDRDPPQGAGRRPGRRGAPSRADAAVRPARRPAAGPAPVPGAPRGAAARA
jgi:DNA-binding SARP family transcriptional activator